MGVHTYKPDAGCGSREGGGFTQTGVGRGEVVFPEEVTTPPLEVWRTRRPLARNKPQQVKAKVIFTDPAEARLAE